MSNGNDSDLLVLHYFVDEAGDPTLFARRRRSIVGQEGCSKYFILGKLEVNDPGGLDRELETLRAELLADPYFKSVPSMQPGDGKTAVMFHAKDDLPEVRYRVLKLLASQAVSFYAVVRDKHRLAEQVLARNQADPDYWHRENELYDDLVHHLFKSRFHRGDHFEICFARRGKSDRTAALQLALDQARQTYEQTWGVQTKTTIRIQASTPRVSGGLQAVDYFLWALQRLYEKGEDRFWEVVRPQAKLVYDMDDIRTAPHGIYYTPSNPLTIAARAKK